MSKNLLHLILIAGLVLTLVGLITGKFIFLLAFVPLGWLFYKKKDDGD